MVRAFRTLTLLLTVAAAAACSTKNTTAPPLSGPSELALSITMAATPDILTQDGASQSQVIVLARDPNGKAITSLSVRLEITQGGQVVDYGVLSSKNVVTGSDGRASAVYTAPRAPVVSVDTGTVVTVLATPIGSNYASSVSHSVEIRLVPPGVIIPPSDLVAGFTFTPSAPAELDPVVFTAPFCSALSVIGCTAGTVESFTWDFGDGVKGSGQTVTHRFNLGTYPVTLTVKDPAGRAASTTQVVTVKAGEVPKAKFDVSPTAPNVNQAVFFNAAGSTASTSRAIIGYQWDFGDGRSGSGVTASHTYTLEGSYVVTLVVTDDAGRIGTTSNSVKIGVGGAGGPIAKFTFSPSAPSAHTTVNFNAADSTSPNGIVDYVWDFGDGTGITYGVTTQHAFAVLGSYVVRLTITDTKGLTATTTVSVVVN